MSLDIDRINGLLSIVKEASGHPAKLSGLVAMAMKELEGHSAEAKKEHDKILADEAKALAAAKASDADKAKRLADEEARKAHLTSQLQPTAQQIAEKKKVEEAKAKAEADAEAKRVAEQEEQERQRKSQEVQADGPETVRRREISEEANDVA